MPRRLLLLALCSPVLFAADPVLESANAKMDKFSKEQWKPGEVVVLTLAEVNAWIRDQTPKAVPQGIRDPKIELGADTASASAMVDIVKMQESKGKTPNFMLKTMFDGEHPLKVYVRLTSSGGKCTVYLTRVEISGASMEGTLLDYLVKGVFLPLYPDAKINQPFDLDYNIDRIELHPDAIRITIKK